MSTAAAQSSWSQRLATYIRTVDRNPWIPSTPHPKQRTFLLFTDEREVLFGGAARGGKALSTDTPIPTPSGWTTMEDLRPGDQVFGQDGQPVEVLAAYAVMLGHACYRVGFDDGSSIVADAPHRWRTWTARDRRLGRRSGLRDTQAIAETLGAAHWIARAGPGRADGGLPASGSAWHRIVSCEPVPSVPVRCIQVSASDGMFLAGPSRVPTHNTEALLMAAAQYLQVPGYAALLLRQNIPDLKKADGLIPRSLEWWSKTAAVWNAQDKLWTFPCPGGGKSYLQFGFCERERDVYQYQGSQYAFIGWDELTQFPEFPYTYLFSRQSRPVSGPLAQAPLRVRSGSNPGGPGHDWVKRRFIDPKTRRPGVVFVPSFVADNLTVDQQSYLESLSYLDPITRAQLLAGDWSEYRGGRFKAEWLRRRYQTINEDIEPGGEYRLGERIIPAAHCWRFQTVDPAASSEETVNGKDPDYTVIATWAVTPDHHLIWLDCERFRVEIPDILPRLQAAYARWQPLYVAVEAVASGRAVFQFAQRTHMLVRELSPRGRDKLVRSTPATVLAEAGRLWLPVAAPWLDDVESELLRFTGSDKHDDHDDCVDVLSYASASLDEYDSGHPGKPLALHDDRRYRC